MNAHIGKSTGIALLMAAALLAALFAMGVFGPGGVSGHDQPLQRYIFEGLNLDTNSDGEYDSYHWVIPENSKEESFGMIAVGSHLADSDNETVGDRHDAVTLKATEFGAPAVLKHAEAPDSAFTINTNTGLLRYSGAGLDYETDAEADVTGTPDTLGVQPVDIVTDDTDSDPNVEDRELDTTTGADAIDIDGRQFYRLAVIVTLEGNDHAAIGEGDRTAYVYVTVSDVDDAPMLTPPSGQSIRENTPMKRDLGMVTATDQDNDNGEITFTLAQAPEGFSLGTPKTNTAGQREAMISYDGDGLNFEEYPKDDPNITLKVTATSGSLSKTEDVKIEVINQQGEKPEKADAPMLSYYTDADAERFTTDGNDSAVGDSLRVRWTAPENDGPGIFQYILEYKKKSTPGDAFIRVPDNMLWNSQRQMVISDGTVDHDGDDITDPADGMENPATGGGTAEKLLSGTSAFITGLDQDVEYLVRVKAQNMDGRILTSVASDASMALAPTVAPDEPTSLMLTAGDGSLSASWTEPEMDGGIALTYKVMWRTIGQTKEQGSEHGGITGTSFNIPNLTNGTRYTVSVSAVNAIGESDSSEERSATPVGTITAPSIPMNLALENPTTTSVLARWNPPASNGGSAITGFQVQYMVGSGNFMTVTPAPGPSATSQLISFESATSSRTITVQVRAMNSADNGPWDTSRTSIPAAAVVPTALNNTPPKTFDATKSSSPGATVRVELKAMLTKGLGQGIVIKLDKFGLPSSISKDDVTIESNDGLNYFDGNPRDVAVGSNTVTLYLGTLDGPGDATMRTLDSTKLTTITIQQTAGITHPNVAGDYTVQIDGKDSVNQATVVREISVKPTSAARDEEITVTGKGFASGDAQVYIDNSKNKDMDDADVGEPVAVTDGSFELVTTVGSGFKGGMNTINATDSAGEKAAGATFDLKAKITVSPDEVAIAQELTIKLSDWCDGRVTAVRFAGGKRMDVSSDNSTYDGEPKCTGEVKVIVPDGTRRGKVNVYLFVGSDGTAEGTAVATIATLDLSVSPSSVVPGQRVTITGSDFAKNQDVTSIKFGNEYVDPLPADAVTTSTGRVSVTVSVPLNVGTGDKTVALTAGAITGNGEVTVAKPSITVSPEESLPGTIVSVSGSGFASGERLEVLYDGVFEETGRADTNGNFSLRLQIPSDAGIGTTNKVKVQVRNQLSINASADHKTPGAMITLPTQAQSGSMITITGSNFAPFSVLSKVTIGTQNAMPSPAPETDRNGQFSFQARVPRLGVGSHNVTVEDSATPKNTATETFTVSDTPVVSTPAEVFGSLGDKLLVVWRFDNATSSWASYDPNAPAELNDLTGVSRGDIVWVEVTENVMFQGSTLYAGWNLISLE